MSFDQKTTKEVLGIAHDYVAVRASGDGVEKVLADGALTDLQKLKHAYDYATHQRKQPRALVAWLEEAIERETSEAGD